MFRAMWSRDSWWQASLKFVILVESLIGSEASYPLAERDCMAGVWFLWGGVG